MPRPPSGYYQDEYPLPHDIEVTFELNGEAESQNSTIVPIMIQDEALTTPETVMTNPRNSAFAESNDMNVYPGSIIPNIKISIDVYMTKHARETDLIQEMIFNWMPIYTSFKPTLEVEDDKTAVQVEDILEMTHEDTDKQAYPLWSGTDLDNATIVPSHVPGLTASQTLESVAFDSDLFWDAMHYYTNKGMLKKVTGAWRRIKLNKDKYSHYHYFSNNFTQPMVKRANKYMSCNILYHLPQGGDIGQTFFPTEVSATSHLRVIQHVRYDEWNPRFDSSAI